MNRLETLVCRPDMSFVHNLHTTNTALTAVLLQQNNNTTWRPLAAVCTGFSLRCNAPPPDSRGESITEASQSAGGPNPGPYLGQTNMPHTHSISRRTRHRLAHTHTRKNNTINRNKYADEWRTYARVFVRAGHKNISHILCCVLFA